MLLRTAILCLVLLPCLAFSQVHSLTLGLDVNSPYGLSEPWFTLRNALLRCDDLQTVAERPDIKAATAEVTTKAGHLPDLAKLQKAVSESGAGASLRGVEATIEGEVVSAPVLRSRTVHPPQYCYGGRAEGGQDKWLLRVAEKEILLRPLTELVQQERKRPRPATADELGAYEHLIQRAKETKRWRVTGPLRSKSEFTLEVRSFEQGKTK